MSKCTDVAVRKRLQGAMSGYDVRLIMRIQEQVEEIYKEWTLEHQEE
jgi:hypothetical protein